MTHYEMTNKELSSVREAYEKSINRHYRDKDWCMVETYAKFLFEVDCEEERRK